MVLETKLNEKPGLMYARARNAVRLSRIVRTPITNVQPRAIWISVLSVVYFQTRLPRSVFANILSYPRTSVTVEIKADATSAAVSILYSFLFAKPFANCLHENRRGRAKI